MSNTMTSDPYGIKVKEKKDHIPFGGIILRYIGGADKPWTVQANTDSLWYNGKEYNTGSTIFSFKEGTDNKGLPFMIGEPKEDPETGIISWYFYRITGLYSKPFTPIPDEYDPGVPDPPEPTPPAGPLCTYTVRRYGDGPVITSSLIEIKKFVDGVEVGSKRIGKKDIQNYKIAHSSNYWNCIRVFRNLLVDWSDHIEVGPSLYESGYVLISDIDYLEYNGATYQKKNTIASWPQYEDIQIDITDWSTYEPTKMENNYKKIQVSSKKGAPSTVIFSKIDGNVVAATKEVTLAELQAYKASHDNKPMKIFENILFDYSYRFLVISNSEYLRYEEFPKYSGEVIEAWYTNEYVDFEVYDYSLNYENTMEKDDIYVVQLEYLKYESDPYGHGYYTNPDVKDPDDPTKSLPNPWKVTKDKVYYDVCWDHLEMYYNGHYHDAAWLVYDNPNEGHKKFGKIAISYCEPFWVLITCVDGVVWNGTAYKGKKLLKMWKKDEAVNLTMSYKKYRKVQSSAKRKDFDEIKYIIETAESNNTITVEKRINDLVDDTIVFDPETDCPVTFHTIRFGFQNGKINLYANGDYVRLGSTSYRKNKLMTSWELSEKVYFAVTDISNQYEVEKTITYEIKTEQVTVTDFEVETNPDKSVSLYKMIYGEPSGEETVRYYDAMYDGGYVYEKLLISFDPAPMMWSLISQSDDIYIENVNYPNGTIIATWAYGESFQLSGIGHITDSDSQIRLTSTEVDSKKSYETEIEHVTYPEFSIVTQSNYSLNVTNDQAGSTPTTINIRSFDAPVLFYGLKFLYDSTYGGWILKSDRDDIYYNGENYKKGKEISKWLYYDEVDLTVDSWVEDIKHTTRLDKIKNLVVSTTDGWLYGYIWMKFPQPGPTPSKDYVWDVIPVDIRNDGNGYRYICMVNTTFGSRVVKRVDDTLNSQYNRIRVDDKFYFEKLGLVSLTYQESSSSGVYTYSATISNSKMRWTYRSSDLMRDFVQANLPFVKARSTEYVQFQIAYAYTDPGVHTFTKVLWNEYMSIRKSTISESVTLDSGNHYYGVKYYEIEDPIIFVYRPNSPDWHIIQYTSTEQSLPVAEWINIDDLSVTKYVYSRWRDKDSIVQLIYDRAVQYFRTLRIYEVSNEFSTASYTIGNFIFYISGWGRYEYSGEFIFYSYSVIEIYNYKTDELVESPVVIEATDLANSSIFEFYNYTVFEGKYIYAYKPKYLENTYDYEEIEIYQADITNVESILTPTLVNTISKTQQINCFLLESGTYETLTPYDILFERHSYAWEGDVFCETILYDDRIDKFGKNKTGFFRPLLREYLGNGIYNDKLMVYIPDPSFQSLNNVFGFMASTLRYSSQINEPQPSPEPHN